MELIIIEKNENAVEIEFRGENDTLLNLLKERLLADDKVANATYVMGHPLLDQPRLYVEVTDKKPLDHLKAAAKDLRKSLDEFETLFLKAQ